jgi:lysophospholipase L1-like esterase
VRIKLAGLALAGLVTLALAVSCSDGDANDSAGDPANGPVLVLEAGDSGVLLALGDSIAAGSGASDPATTSYVALVAEALRSRFDADLTVESLAAGGHTTQTLIDDQLEPALASLRQGDVLLVTITIGGNDLSQYGAHEACIADPTDLECPLEDGLLEVENHFDTIFSRLREVSPDVAIVVQLYPNLFSGTGHEFTRQAEAAFRLLNGVIVGVARSHDVSTADPRRAFEGQGQHLTHVLDDVSDAHPNDAGYQEIADAFLAALGVEE